jgi:hypothetical protein
MALPLARAWHERGGYFTTVAGRLFELHATAADRRRLEAFVAAHAADDGIAIGDELEALARLGDPASVPLLLDVAMHTRSSRARTHALRGLARVGADARAQAALRGALWDCEDAASDVACLGMRTLDAAAGARVRALASSRLVDAELAARAAARLAAAP